MAPSPPARRPAIWRHRIVAAFTERLALKGTALLLGILLWVIVGRREKMEMRVPVRFVPQLDSTLVLREDHLPIRALVLGTPNELMKLDADPPVIHRAIAADAPDTLVLDLRAQDVEIPSGIDADVLAVTPRSITLHFEPTSTRRVPVRAEIQVASAAPPGSIRLRLEPTTVEVSGPRLAVLRIGSIATVKTTISVDSLPHLVDLDTARLGVRVRPPQVRVQLVPLPSAATPVPPAAVPDSTAVSVPGATAAPKHARPDTGARKP